MDTTTDNTDNTDTTTNTTTDTTDITTDTMDTQSTTTQDEEQVKSWCTNAHQFKCLPHIHRLVFCEKLLKDQTS